MGCVSLTTEICQPMKNATTKPKRTRNRLGSRELVRPDVRIQYCSWAGNPRDARNLWHGILANGKVFDYGSRYVVVRRHWNGKTTVLESWPNAYRDFNYSRL